MEILLLYLLLGAFVGVVAGLFGVGGGLIIVPALLFIFHGSGMSATVVMHMAIGTSLATIMVTSLSSVRAHHQHGAVLWPIVAKLAPGIVAGTLFGAYIVNQLPNATLRIIFGVFELLVAAQMAFGIKAAPHRQLPGWPGMSVTGAIIGKVSAIIGIGGGTLTVPFLVWCNTGIRQAVATSAACGLPIAVAGTVGFVITGWNTPQLPAWSTGYIYWPAFAGIALASVLSAPLGARLAHTLPVGQLRIYFSLLLALLGMRMLLFS
ncbi:MAG: sulfite exporter TauE/SafE family protein [Gammaproteobacteria bacterium]|nr:sulfite exporter TauE/SafE family protein [Gammaproteobacteria bacterium]